jgi:hypothetical protein
MTPKKPEWFELTEGNDAYAGITKINKKLPIATLAMAGAIILGGSLFATANNEPSAVAETPTASQSVAAAQTSTVAPAAPAAPIVAAAPQRGDDREHEDRSDD